LNAIFPPLLEATDGFSMSLLQLLSSVTAANKLHKTVFFIVL
jgi:hypothetical protein